MSKKNTILFTILLIMAGMPLMLTQEVGHTTSQFSDINNPENVTGSNKIYLPSVVHKKTQVAFVSDRDGDKEIFLMSLDNNELVQLTNNNINDEGPSWSPDGDEIVFHSSRDGYHQIYKMNADGSNQTRLLNSSFTDEIAYWSTNGDKIAFSRYFDHNGDGFFSPEVFTMNVDGTGVTRLTFSTGHTGSFGHGCWPSGWSPDGAQILFYCYIDGNDQLWIMDADGNNQEKLIADANWNAIPSMSPDGSKIAFASFRDGNYEIYTSNSDGSNQIRITYQLDEDWRPIWSLGGLKILFEANRDGQTEVYWMNSDGSQQENLTNNNAYDGQAVWQP